MKNPISNFSLDPWKSAIGFLQSDHPQVIPQKRKSTLNVVLLEVGTWLSYIHTETPPGLGVGGWGSLLTGSSITVYCMYPYPVPTITSGHLRFSPADQLMELLISLTPFNKTDTFRGHSKVSFLKMRSGGTIGAHLGTEDKPVVSQTPRPLQDFSESESFIHEGKLWW